MLTKIFQGGVFVSSYDLDRGSSGIISDINSNLNIKQEIAAGQRVRVKHFNIPEYAITFITEAGENTFKIKITEKLLRYNVFPGDTITVIYVTDQKEECLIDGIVESAQAEFPQFFSIRGIRIRRFRDSRKSRRYEIDICCNILVDGNVYFGNAKNISFSGCRLITKEKIEDRKNFKIELFIEQGKKAVIDVGMVRSKKHISFYEYGLAVLGMDDSSRRIIQEKINQIMETENNIMK